MSLILQNPIVLYLVGLIALGNLLMLAYARQFMCIGVFIMSALLASFFTKNKVVTLVVAMVVCNIVGVSSGHHVEEGFGMLGRKGNKKQEQKTVITLGKIEAALTKLTNKDTPVNVKIVT
jgi:hypothetical protein